MDDEYVTRRLAAPGRTSDAGHTEQLYSCDILPVSFRGLFKPHSTRIYKDQVYAKPVSSRKAYIQANPSVVLKIRFTVHLSTSY